MQKEARQHTGLALGGLAKLPNVRPGTEGYRGLTLTKDELSRYKKGQQDDPAELHQHRQRQERCHELRRKSGAK